MAQPQRPEKVKPPPRLPRWYPGDPPGPVPWWSYHDSRVVKAVFRYLWMQTDSHGHPIPCTVQDGRWLLAYLQYAAEAPWPGVDPAALADLRRRAYLLGGSHMVGEWLQDALEAGLDVLGDFWDNSHR